MKVIEGTVVRSAAGRDKGDFQVIVKIEPGFVWVCDGRHRPLGKIKKKKIIHLYLTNTVLDVKNLRTNKLIRCSLREFMDKLNKN
ncbi:MAG: KOW domain-containing RNA-binding protein [Candidatus Improbicoccus devescovinae]|nr:MAG: KOW domain-containing RNA-binding protein [Candidatus Improbicoccus devescovinae]